MPPPHLSLQPVHDVIDTIRLIGPPTGHEGRRSLSDATRLGNNVIPADSTVPEMSYRLVKMTRLARIVFVSSMPFVQRRYVRVPVCVATRIDQSFISGNDSRF